MNYDELGNLSKPELVKLLHKQRQTIQTLQARIHHNGTGSCVSNDQLNTHTRQALRRINDIGWLGQCPLLAILKEKYRKDWDGIYLQQFLTQAIAVVKPVNRRSNRQRQLRYDILRMTYLNNKRPPAIIKKLAISERQYYRELKAAIEIVGEHLLGSL